MLSLLFAPVLERAACSSTDIFRWRLTANAPRPLDQDGVAVAEPDVVAERGRRLHVGVAELRCHAAAEPGAAELAQEDL
jgi:hypothetical protein